MTPLELAEEYVERTGVSLFLTGKAGTGKTTFLHRLVATTHKRCVVVAPTGVAAVNAAGVTIHSFFQLPLCPYLPDVKELVTEYQMPDKFTRLRKEKIKIIRTLDLLIIDEISMVRADLLDAVDMTLRRYRRSGKPFGGVQLLMIGDVQQLPPVLRDEEKVYMEQVYPSPFFFHSKALQRLHYVTIELTHIFRQQDGAFIELLNKVRENRMDAEALRTLNSRYRQGFNPPDSEGYIRLTTHNRQAAEVNQRKLAALQEKPFKLKAKVEGNFPATSFPTEEVLTLKKGAQVMFVRNDSNGHAYYNGKIATVEGYDAEEGVAVVDKEGNHIVVNRERWENVRYEIDASDNQIKPIEDGTFEQYPLKLAWAITIHKSQGLTFDKVVLDAASAFTFGQVYVALSRCRTLEGLVLVTPISSSCLFDNEEVLEFNRGFDDIEQVGQALTERRVSFYFDMLNELFDFSQLQHSAERLNRIFYQYLLRQLPETTQQVGKLATESVVSLTSVAEKFRHQLTNIQMGGSAGVGDAYLKERVKKAADYFAGVLEQIAEEVVPIAEVKTGNKAIANDLDETLRELQDELGMKQLCLQRVHETGFSTDGYSRAKADFTLEKEKRSETKSASYRKRETKSSAPKPKRPPVWESTVEMYRSGKTIAEIAKEKEVKYATITKHLEDALEAGAIAAEELAEHEELVEIENYMLKEKPQTLKEANDYFEGLYPYYKLYVARYELRRKQLIV